jgi:Mg-chelatase subunit ChlD
MFFEDKSSIPVELRCGVCAHPWWPETAIACPKCEEIFCRVCIEDHLAKSTTCPKCHAEVDPKDMQRPHRQLKSMAARTPVLCPNRPGGCWKGPWGELETHLRACPFDPSKIVFVDEADPDLQCEVCLSTLRAPEKCPLCQQLFCGACLRQSLQRESKCPHCRRELVEDLVQEAPRQVTSMLAKLRVSCITNCGWTGPHSEYDAHLPACPLRTAAHAPAATAAPLVAPPATAVPAPTVVSAVPDVEPIVVPRGAPTEVVDPSALRVTLSAMNYHPQIHAADRVTTFTAMAHIKAPHATQAMAASRKDLHIAAVMDISGSMKGEKLRLAKAALSFVVAELSANDRFGLIAFDDRVEEAHRAVDMTDVGRTSVLSAIAGLKDRGSTNLSGGLFAGIAQARDLPFVAPNAAAVMQRSAPPPARPGVMNRLASRLFGAGDNSDAATAATVRFADPEGASGPTPPRVSTGAPAFDLKIRYNCTPMKQDGKWLARYTFETSSTLPAEVSHISMHHATAGRITLRGKSTFGLIADLNAIFTVEVNYQSNVGCNQQPTFAWSVSAEDETGVGSFAVPAFVPRAQTSRARIVMLFTDGVANAGITEPTALTTRTREILQSMPDKDVTIFTFGFGDNHNASLLQQIAESSQGSYYFIQRTDQLKEVFADCIGGLLSIIATNIKLDIAPAFGVRITKVLTQFPYTMAPNHHAVVTIKDLYAEEERDILVEVEVAPRAVGGAGPVVNFTLTCDNVALAATQTETAVSAVPTVAEPFTGKPNELVDQQLVRVLAAQAMEEAQKLADAGEVAAANQRLRVMQSRLATTSSAETKFTRDLNEDLLQAVQHTETKADWQSTGQKFVGTKKNAHSMQRSNAVDYDMSSAYATNAKSAMSRKARDE